MNILLLFRLILSLKDAQNRISDEAEAWESKHQITSPKAKRMALIMSGGKILMVMMIMGELPFFDIWPNVVSLGERLGWLGVLVVTSSVLTLLLFFISFYEKEEQRDVIVANETIVAHQQRIDRQHELRLYRKASKFLPDV